MRQNSILVIAWPHLLHHQREPGLVELLEYESCSICCMSAPRHAKACPDFGAFSPPLENHMRVSGPIHAKFVFEGRSFRDASSYSYSCAAVALAKVHRAGRAVLALLLVI